jgi:hypothetical protein
MMLDDLELELRKLPGVRAAGFDDRDDMLLVQLHVTPTETTDTPLPVAATRIAARHSDRPVAVEVIRWREREQSRPVAPVTSIAPPAPAPAPEPEPATTAAPETATPERATRPRLLAVLSFPDTDELEVHLILEGRRTIGRAPATRGLPGAVDATLAAIRSLGADLTAKALWARALEAKEDSTLVAVALDAGDDVSLYGMASGANPIDGAARATLDAVNRRLSHLLAS